MALLNPVHTFVVPFLLVVTVPLALLAGITTTLAFSILSFRVVLVYLDIALSLVPQCFGAAAAKARHPSSAKARHRLASPAGGGAAPAPAPSHHPVLARRRHRQPSSVTSFVSAGSTTPGGDMAMGLMPSVGPDRDFEGIGGWRSDGDGDDDAWATINSRLELPDGSLGRNHHRSPSGGPVTPGDGGVLMIKLRALAAPPSPNSCRARTPSASRGSVVSLANSDGYFPLAMSPTSTRKLMSNQI